MNMEPLTQEEKQYLIDRGWVFISDEYVELEDDYDGCMAYGVDNIRHMIAEYKRRESR